jgi:hypothetical protein
MVDTGNNFEAARHRQFTGTQIGKALLHIDHEQGSFVKLQRRHDALLS